MSRVRREMKWNAEREIINRQRGDFVMKGKGWRYKLIRAARRAKTFFPFAAVGERFLAVREPQPQQQVSVINF